MSWRTVKPGADERLDSFGDYDRRPSLYATHHGTCPCGVETSRSMLGIGWQCKDCGEQALQAQFKKATS